MSSRFGPFGSLFRVARSESSLIVADFPMMDSRYASTLFSLFSWIFAHRNGFPTPMSSDTRRMGFSGGCYYLGLYRNETHQDGHIGNLIHLRRYLVQIDWVHL